MTRTTSVRTMLILSMVAVVVVVAASEYQFRVYVPVAELPDGSTLVVAIPADLLPEDPWERTACKALRGDYGLLAYWQQVGYQLIADGEGRQHTAWVTYYWTGELGVNRICSTGYTVSNRVAAMRKEQAAPYDFVMVKLPGGYQLRQILDTGSYRNLSRARSRGATHWVDLWVPQVTNRSYIAQVLVVKR